MLVTPTTFLTPYFVVVEAIGPKLHIEMGYTGGNPDNIQDITKSKQEGTPGRGEGRQEVWPAFLPVRESNQFSKAFIVLPFLLFLHIDG